MLVGSLKPNTVAELLRTLVQAKAHALLLLEREGQSGYVTFEDGTVSSASLEELRNENALAALRRWQHGHYALRRRTEDQPVASLGHAFVLVSDSKLSKRISRYLVRASYETSMVFFPEELDLLVGFLQPHLVITDCPRSTLGVSCEQLVQRWCGQHAEPPTLIPLTDETHSCGCTHPQGCRLVGPPSEDELLRVVKANRPDPGTAGQAESELQQVLQRELAGLQPSDSSISMELPLLDEAADDELARAAAVTVPVNLAAARDAAPNARETAQLPQPTPDKDLPAVAATAANDQDQTSPTADLPKVGRSRGAYLMRAAAVLLAGSSGIWLATYLLISR